MEKPKQEHLTLVYRVLKYLKSMLGQGILLKSYSNPVLSVYSDNDWVGCPNTHKSVIGYYIFLGESLVS